MPARYWLGAVGSLAQASATEITGRIRFPNDEGFEETCDASNAGVSTIVVEDPTSTFTPRVWQPFWVTEDDCTTDTRIYTGFIMEIDYSRSPQQALVAGSTARLIALTLVDLNGLAKLRIIRGTSGQRPVESTIARTSWLLSDVLDGVVFDNGLLDLPSTNRDEADFRGQYANDVLAAMAQDGALDTYIVWQEAAPAGEEVTLVVEPTDGAQRVSSLAISNVLSETTASPTTIFPPDPGATLKRDGTEVYSGVLLRWAGGDLYDTHPATDGTYFGPYGRDWIEDEQRIGRLGTAQSVATTLLEQHSAPIDSITCKVILPTSKVNLIRAGMALDAKFSHFPSYSSNTRTKVKKRAVRELAHDTTSRYELTLELSTGITVSGPSGPPAGGGPVLPPAPTNPTFVQGTCHEAESGTGGSSDHVTATLASPPTPGNLIIFSAAAFDGADLAANIDTSTWTLLGAPQAGNQGAAMAYRVAQAGDTGVENLTTAISGLSYRAYVEEWSGLGTSPTSKVYENVAGPLTTLTFTVADAGGVTFSVASENWVLPYTASSGWTTDCNGLVGGHSIQPYTLIAHSTTTSTNAMAMSGPTDPTYRFSGVIASFPQGSTDEDGTPPRPGQPVGTGEDLELVGSGDGTTATFTTRYPYLDGSLHVMVDRSDQTAGLVATNGATGSFTLGFAPAVGEQVEVWYQGRGSPAPPTSIPDTSGLQAAINATPSGGTLNITGGTYQGHYTIAHAMTLIGGTIIGNSKATDYAVRVEADNVTLSGVTIQNAFIAVYVDQCDNVTVQDCTLQDLTYAGVLTIGAANCLVDSNTIRRISGETSSGEWNAYGVSFSYLGGSGNSSACIASNNTISYIPTWHGLDTHAGVNCQFNNNTIFACRRGIFLTTAPTNATANANDITAPTSAQKTAAKAAYGGNSAALAQIDDTRGISHFGGTGSITNNTGHGSFNQWYTNGGGTYSASGNNPTIP